MCRTAIGNNRPKKVGARDAEQVKVNFESISRSKLSALIVVGVFALSACGGSAAESKSGTSENSSTSAEQTKPAMSKSESQYAAYLDTLTPAQKAVRESFSQNNLQSKTPEQISALFKIPLSEVEDDGKIDSMKYAEAFLCRNEAEQLIGSSTSRNLEEMKQAATELVPITDKAFYGYIISDISSNITFLTFFDTVEGIRKDHNYKFNVDEDYHVRSELIPDSVRVDTTSGKLDLKFRGYGTDNWPEQEMASYIGIKVKPFDMTSTWYMSGLHTDSSGNVYPEKIVLNSQNTLPN